MLRELIEKSIKEILTGEKTEEKTSDKLEGTRIDKAFLGQNVMIRTYSAGVHFGTLRDKIGDQIILDNSRRVYSWDKACSLSQLAMEGSKSIDTCKIAVVVNEILLENVIEVIPMTAAAYDQLFGAKEWKS